MDQMMLTPTEFQLAQERSLKYLGTAKVYINRIVPHPSISRELDPKNVERLSEVFSHDGCRRLDIRNHVTAVVSRQHLAVALQTAGVTTRSLKTSPPDQYPLLEFSVGQIQCLHGQHRLAAAKEQLPPPEQWWTVDLYLDDLSTNLLTALVDEYSNEKIPSDGEVYLKVRQYQYEGNAHFENRWMARLSPNKVKRFKQLSSRTEIRAAFDRLRMIPALLLQGMKFGSLPRVLATSCNEEIVHGLSSLLEEWSHYLSYDREKMMKLDPQTVARLQGKAPGVSSQDATEVEGLVLSGATQKEENDHFLDNFEEEEWWTGDESEDSECEQDIEEHEYTTPGDTARTVKIRLFLTDEGVDRSMWMKTFTAECTYDGVVVATALARYIDREGIRSEFWKKMELPSEEMRDVAFQLFDRYGTVKAKYKDHPVQRGSGIWGNELDYGPLFLFEELHVAAELRRKGLGHKIASLLLDKAKQFCLEDKPDSENADLVYGSNQAFERAWTLHALVDPGILTADIESQSVGKSVEERLMIRTRVQFEAIYFWRACGFRRIGASCYFAFSYDSQHESHALDAASDFDPRQDYSEDLEDEELHEKVPFSEVKKLKLERLRDSLPLHHAALTLADDELKEFFMTHADDDHIGWDHVTASEATLLHLTACQLKPLSTRWLLESVPNTDSWRRARDIDGYTPLEALREDLEIMRTQKEIGTGTFLSDHFRGYPDTAVSCLALLSGPDTLRLSDACLRYGCTCGECLEGFISARMSSALIFQGETTYDHIQEGIDDGSFWVKDNDYLLIHLDHDVRRNLRTNKSFRKGFANIFRIAVECLKANRIPTAESLEWCCNNRSEWPPDTKNYLRRSGTAMGCRAVLRYMFDAAKEEDEKAGNGECQLVLKEAWSDLPTCRNDHEFEFVARACGYGGDDFISLQMW